MHFHAPIATDWRGVLLWSCLLLPFYSYACYPLLIVTMSTIQRFLGRRKSRHTVREHQAPLPPVAIVVSAYNEEQHIAELVHNLCQLDYAGPVTLYIGSDGSSDRTGEILKALAVPRLRSFLFPVNRGKASVLNDLLAAVTEPIVAFTDANTRLATDSLSRLVRRFDDPKVGAVCGELMLRPEVGGDNVDGLYWRVERVLKECESALGALVGANGGIYAIRRECFAPLAADTVVDDFCIAMTAAAAGRALVYEPEARASEMAPPQISDEYTRRVRIGIGNYQAFFRHPEYLFRTGAMRSFAYVSHKVLRWFTPHLLLIALVTNALLLDQSFYLCLGVAQIALYGVCLVFYALSPRVPIPRLLRAPVFLVAMNVAFGVGFFRYVTGQYSGSWKRTARA